MDIRTHARAEIDAINRTLANHGVDAGAAPAWTTIAGDSYIIYELKLGAQTTVATVEKRLPELAEAISALRRQRTPVRLRTMPLALEVAHPAPAPLRWQTAGVASLPPHAMLAGRSYNGRSQDETVHFSQAPHVLVAGLTGSGKSTLMLMLLLSLAINTPPDELEIHLIDLKNEDLVPLQRPAPRAQPGRHAGAGGRRHCPAAGAEERAGRSGPGTLSPRAPRHR